MTNNQLSDKGIFSPNQDEANFHMPNFDYSPWRTYLVTKLTYRRMSVLEQRVFHIITV